MQRWGTVLVLAAVGAIVVMSLSSSTTAQHGGYTQETIVVNDTSEPVNTREGAPAEPFFYSETISWPVDTPNIFDSLFVVPDGKILVVEDVTASALIPSDQQILLFNLAGREIAASRLSDTVIGTRATWAASRTVRWYLDGNVVYTVLRGDENSAAPGAGNVRIAVTGYLVDAAGPVVSACAGDANGDGVVDLHDLVTVFDNFGTNCS